MKLRNLNEAIYTLIAGVIKLEEVMKGQCYERSNQTQITADQQKNTFIK